MREDDRIVIADFEGILNFIPANYCLSRGHEKIFLAL